VNTSTVFIKFRQKVDLTKYIEETTFNFDHAYDEESTNESIYHDSIRPLIDSAFEGAKISCFAYGQTGSGKTFTMKGDMVKGVPGLYFLAAKEIFNYIEHVIFSLLFSLNIKD
jgi:kinesin family protein 2/24